VPATATADGAQATAAAAAPPADAPRKTPKRPLVRGAQALPAHLERREVLVPPAAEECQQAIFDKRHGVRLPTSTLGDWVVGASYRLGMDARSAEGAH
jgi:hypothetical protein